MNTFSTRTYATRPGPPAYTRGPDLTPPLSTGVPHMPSPVALITGASRGLGLEIARLYAARAYKLVITARGAVALQQAADELSTVTEVFALPGDVADEGHARRLVAAGLERFGQIDILINNASLLGPMD